METIRILVSKILADLCRDDLYACRIATLEDEAKHYFADFVVIDPFPIKLLERSGVLKDARVAGIEALSALETGDDAAEAVCHFCTCATTMDRFDHPSAYYHLED